MKPQVLDIALAKASYYKIESVNFFLIFTMNVRMKPHVLELALAQTSYYNIE